jgi:hypothetical protein
MEKFKNILDNIKDRLTNPLIFSFVCSWLVVNWQITISLLWYDPSQLTKAGYASIFDFIGSRINSWDAFGKPMIFAISYTLFMPIVKNLIRALQAWASKWGDKWNLAILAEGKISIDRYLKLKADHAQRSKILEDAIEQESAFRESYNKVQTALLSTQNDFNETRTNLSNLQQYIQQLYDMSILNGTWVNNYEFSDGRTGTENVHIEHNKYYVISQYGERAYKFDIRHFHYDSRTKTVFFVKELTQQAQKDRPEAERHSINALRFESRDLMAGTENGYTKIEYKRQ